MDILRVTAVRTPWDKIASDKRYEKKYKEVLAKVLWRRASELVKAATDNKGQKHSV